MHTPPVVRELWLYLLRKVNWKDNGRLLRGSGFFQFDQVQKDLCWYVGYRKMTYSKPQLTKALRRLREERMIETTKETRGVIVTVLNYAIYQDFENCEGNDEGKAKETRRNFAGITILEEVEEVRSKKKIRGTFVPPSIEEVSEFCKNRKNNINPEKFVNFYQAKGWMVGKNKMKDWRAAVVTWEQPKENKGGALPQGSEEDAWRAKYNS